MNDWDSLRNHLMRGGNYGHFWVSNSKQYTQWWKVDSCPPPPTEGNIYFGVNPVTEVPTHNYEGKPTKPEYVRSRIAIIAAINCLFAEYDAKDFEDGKMEIREILALTDPEPSVLIDSGGGYHAYWLLANTYPLDSDHARRKAQHLQASWVGYVGGDKASKDLARILRVPNTYNVKPQYAPSYPLVRFHSGDGELYDLADLEALLPPMPKVEQSTYTPNDNNPNERSEYWLSKYIGSRDDRNRRGVLLATQLRDDGVSQSEAEGIMSRFASAVTGEKPEPYPEKEALKTLAWAYAQPKRRPALTKEQEQPVSDESESFKRYYRAYRAKVTMAGLGEK